MEERIRQYEEYINSQKSDGVSSELIEYHRETLHNFQHERLIHLIIMFFFIALTLVVTGVLVWFLSITSVNYWAEYIPISVATLLLWILSIAYVKHYYFLENHVQRLYDISKELFEEQK